MSLVSVEDLALELQPVVNNQGCKILKLDYIASACSSKTSKLVLSIAKIDDSAVTVKDCAAVSSEVALFLDVNEKIADTYVLEVGSLGCDSMLFFAGDYVKHAGKVVDLHLMRDKNNHMLARIVGAASGKVTFTTLGEQPQKITVPMSSIKKATLVEDL